jgi:ubiquinone/menaquinone biosynthesis C-methylase UbiE
MHQLENPVRVAELNPHQTLQRIGLKPGDSFLDVGAGTGLFAFEAARQTQGLVYAVEISLEMLRILGEKRETTGLENVQVVQGVENAPDETSDLALLCTVLHELEQPEAVLGHIRRALKPGGRLAVIEFYDHPTPMGPPVSHRIGETQASFMLTSAGFSVEGAFELGENLYCLTALSSGTH